MAKRTTSAGRRPASTKPYAGSLGEMLDDAGFEPLGRRIRVSDRDGGTQLPSPPKWFDPVVEFLWAALPDLAANHWDHLYIDALQSACQALVALGQAVLDGSGGMKVKPEPALPSILPRLDDVATVIVCLAAQVGFLEYRHFTGARDRPSPIGLRRPNIRADHGSGPAYLAPEAFRVFESLDLVLGARWTERAETIFWRDNPSEWGLDFTKDRRFIQAWDAALATVPDDIAEKIEKTAVITEESIVEWLQIAPKTKTREDALKSLMFWSSHSLDRVFHRRWRLDCGWLSVEESVRTLLIEHDALSISMRRQFAARYLPHAPFLNE
ncbi:hypothetical protein HUN27_14675 [Agrobacterium tumefaciens]|nr:hypothetical protein [Agrobacterium tumefaciens]